jgi:hypothetical protein
MALELTDSAFGAVHHLTVPAFMIQHPSRLSAYGWRAEVALLREFLDGTSPEAVRRRRRGSGSSLARGASMAPRPVKWSRTICNLRFEDPLVYQDDVRSWAETVADEAPDL